jgi:hypothetical protein
MSKNTKPPKAPEPSGLDEEQLSNAQEALPVPFIAGTQKVSLKWITGIYNVFTRDAPAERPGKK